MLSKGRIQLQGHSPYAWEQDALKFIRETLPDSDPFQVWELVELVDPHSGRLHEIDCLLLGYSALYLVEIKSGPGVYEGDTTDWYRTAPGGPARYMDPPYRLANLKAKVLKGLLERHTRHLPDVRVPFVQPLIFLSDPDVTLKFRNYGDQCVVTRDGFLKAVQFHQFPGVDQAPRTSRVSKPQAKAVLAGLEKIGVRASKGTLRVGSYELGSVLEEGPGYEDRTATHTERETFRRRARIYLVPQQTSTERRQMLLRAADREAQLLEDVKGHPNVLSISDYVVDAPLGPTVLFDHFDGIPLDALLRKRPDLEFDKRVAIIEQIALALDHCHRKQVVHGALSPSAALVSDSPEGKLAVRLYNFQLGAGGSVSSTVHWSSLADDAWSAYQAPELRQDPRARGPISDVFSLGAVAYFTLTGRAPGANGAEVDERLARAPALDPRAVDDSISPAMADALMAATDVRPLNRCDNINDWLHAFFLEALTQPEAPPVPIVDPLEAKRGDVLDGDLKMERVLGQGASSRVLEVERASDGRRLALKVSLSPADDVRLAMEAALLRRFRHARIVQLYDERIIAERTCLLLALAGDSTLSRALSQDGPPSLDYAARFGEDLLSALEDLEEKRILHRDIKPGNLGVGAATKSAKHLVLFDFSLGFDLDAPEASDAGRNQLGVGTTVYRDPFLRERGAWDAAADRWSAAVTLHELLTGVRPSFSPEGIPPWAAEARLSLAAERFDATVRERLVRFFERALDRSAERRFDSARDMRRSWEQAFEVRAKSTPPEALDESDGALAEDEWSPDALARLSREAPVATLPLSSRALNALDRAGLTTAGELLGLPDNRLSAVRGVGRRVAQEIDRFRKAWQATAHVDGADVEAFFPGYLGEDRPLGGLPLGTEVVRCFEDAGLSSLASLAAASRARVHALSKRCSEKATTLEKLLRDAAQAGADEQHPTNVQAWLLALLPKPGKRRHALDVLFGLSEPTRAQLGLTLSDAARLLGVTPAALTQAVAEGASRWAAHPAYAELSQVVRSLVGPESLALRAKDAGEKLLGLVPSGDPQDDLALPRAVALIRMVCAVERKEEAGPRWVRLGGEPWLIADGELTPALRALGKAADQLADRPVLASPGEAVRALRGAAEGTALERLGDDALTALAAAASTHAARSSRLELYPRGLSAARALELTSPALTGMLLPERIRSLVEQRYPEAEPLPPRPALDALLEPLQLRWNPSSHCYVRPGESGQTQFTEDWTRIPTLTTVPTAQRAIHPSHVEVNDFEAQVAVALERQGLRVITASATYLPEVALALRDRFGLRLVDLDRAFLERFERYRASEDIKEAQVYGADALGPDGEDWPQLLSVAREVEAQLAKELLPFEQPTLLVQLGLLARFGLRDFLLQLVSEQRPKAATFILLPGEATGTPQINGRLPIPQVGLPNTLGVPLQWLKARSAA